MAGSCFRLSPSSRSVVKHERQVGLPLQRNKGWNSSLIMVFASLCIAICFAPESPDQLASICERHNSAMACQVW